MAGTDTKDSSQASAPATATVSQEPHTAKLITLADVLRRQPFVVSVKKYYDTLTDTTSHNCFLHMEPQNDQFSITRGGRANVRCNYPNIVNLMCGRNTGLLVICLQAWGSSPLRWLVMDVCPDPNASMVAKAITTWGRWDEVAKVFSVKSHKEKIYDDLIVGLGPRSHPATMKKAEFELFGTHNEEAVAEEDEDEEGGNTNSKAAEVGASQPQSRSTSEAEDGNAAGDPSSIAAPNKVPTEPAILTRPTKRSRLDESGTLFDQTLADFDCWQDTLRKACRSGNDVTKKVAKLKTDNERLEKELKKAESHSLALEEANKTMVWLKVQVVDLQGSEAQLKAEKAAIQKEIETLRAKATQTVQLESELDKVKGNEKLLQTDNEALQDLVGMWLAGVDVNKFLKEVREGKDVKGAFFAASMNK
ncbi:hypothetical protein LTR10_013507 [Elasticomyces elasticus]|uniref:Uncharacterized protein n=1 Tax=Exophiala sideris TaxID=1016849 RepID=A0ABR0JPW0_9EURO|nr:hypothetical protein LTR10_013507 [Elasticomyces elasticus]KAK5039644.1 hypothetical protein LTS07_000138 [Exophiala sideris]KAK5041196.1 hypothetical protein LTR13_002670 [Exophiala sideris]KAK5068021.1 hypothetical protein LTR69_000138 [Exophiala sideris]KAK5187323.1 hypothetical protein LTR44_000138 [Eurotiomycetes sp. CCFEE 6388]